MPAGCCLLVVLAIGEAAGGAHAAIHVRRAGRPPAPIQLVRGWTFRADPGDVGLRDRWERPAAPRRWTPVSMPNDFNPVVSNSGNARAVGWYRLTFKAPLRGTWEVTFDEVRRNATAWLNGRLLGTNDTDSYTPFSFPLTGMKRGAVNLLVVRVDTLIASDSFPQDWWNWGGIMQPVWLTPAGRISLSGLGVMGEVGCRYRCGDLLVQGTLTNTSASRLRPTLIVRATSPAGATTTFKRALAPVRAGSQAALHVHVPIRGRPDLWSPSDPALYAVRVEVAASGRIEQLTALRTGLRTVQVHGGILYLNGHRLWLHGAAIHEDLQGHGAALTDADITTIVSELRSVHANITRAHYLLSQRLLSALDAAGILVWEQPPVDHADPLLVTASGRDRALQMLGDTIVGFRSHPSVIVDSIGNELSPTPDSTRGTLEYLRRAIPLARMLDPTASVALDIYCYPGYPPQRIYRKLDLLGISDYFGWYTGFPGHSIADFDGLKPFLTQTHARYPNQAIVVSEYGAEGLYDGSPDAKGTYEFQSNYLTETLNLLDTLPFMNGSIYWTLREFAVNPGWTGGAAVPFDDPPSGIHHKGLIGYDGTFKPAFTVAQQLFPQIPSFMAR